MRTPELAAGIAPEATVAETDNSAFTIACVAAGNSLRSDKPNRVASQEGGVSLTTCSLPADKEGRVKGATGSTLAV